MLKKTKEISQLVVQPQVLWTKERCWEEPLAVLYRTLVISSILKHQQQNPMDYSIALTCSLSQGRLLLPAGISWCGVGCWRSIARGGSGGSGGSW